MSKVQLTIVQNALRLAVAMIEEGAAMTPEARQQFDHALTLTGVVVLPTPQPKGPFQRGGVVPSPPAQVSQTSLTGVTPPQAAMVPDPFCLNDSLHTTAPVIAPATAPTLPVTESEVRVSVSKSAAVTTLAREAKIRLDRGEGGKLPLRFQVGAYQLEAAVDLAQKKLLYRVSHASYPGYGQHIREIEFKLFVTMANAPDGRLEEMAQSIMPTDFKSLFPIEADSSRADEIEKKSDRTKVQDLFDEGDLR